MRIKNEPVRKTSSVQGVFLGIAVLSLVLAPWFYGLTRFQDQLLCELILFSVVLIFFFFEGLRPHPSWGFRYSGPFDRWVLGALGLSLGYVVISSVPYLSLLTFVRFFSLVWFYFLVRWTVDTEGKFRILAWTLVGLGAVYAAYGLFQFYGYLPHDYWRGARGLASRYVNGGHFAALLLFSLFSGVSLALSEKTVWARALAVVFVGIQAWAFLFTQSRTSWLAFLMGAGILVVMAHRRGYLTFGQSFALTVIPALILWGSWQMGFLDSVVRRFESLWETEFFSLFHRWRWWEGSLDAFLARPWGWGLGAYRTIMPGFRVHSDRFLIDYAHNELVQIGVDLGVLGILFLIGFTSVYFGRLLRFIDLQRASRGYKISGISFVGLGTALALSSLVDFPLRIHANSIFLFTTLALSAHLTDGGHSPEKDAVSKNYPGRRYRKASRGVRIACFVLVLAAWGITARQLMAQVQFEKGKRLEKDFSWDEAETRYRKASSLAPLFAQYPKALGDLYRKRSTVSLNQGQKVRFRNGAIEAFDQAVRVEPHGSGWSHYALGQLYRDGGETEKAIFHFEKAVAEEPKNALYVSDYGEYSLEQHDFSKALDLFEQLKGISFREHVDRDPCQILQKFSSRISRYEDLRRIVPNDLRGHLCLGFVLGEAGDWKKADLEFKAARHRGRAQYDSPQTYISEVGEPIAQFYLSHQRTEEAQLLYEEFARLEPANPRHQEALRGILQKRKPS